MSASSSETVSSPDFSLQLRNVRAASRFVTAFQERREYIHVGSGENVLFSTLLKGRNESSLCRHSAMAVRNAG
jgi:hypothetical protein